MSSPSSSASHLFKNSYVMDYQQPLLKYPHSNNSLLSSGNVKKSAAYEPRTEAISPAINDDIINVEDSSSRSTKDEQTLIVEKLKKVEAEIVQTDLQIVRLRRQKEQLEQAQAAPKHDEDQENVCDTKQLSIAKLVYHENRSKAQKAHAKLECLGGSTDLPVYNQPSDNVVYYQNASKFSHSFKKSLIDCFRSRFQTRLTLEDTVSSEYDRRMEIWLRRIELEDSQINKRMKDIKTRDFFEKQFPELKKARESGERFSRVGQRVARSDAEVAELLDGIMEREDQDKKVKSYAVIPPMLEEMRSKKPKFINTNGYVEDIVAEYKEYQILNTWTDEEKEIFKENYLQHPKNFGLLARMTGRKNVADCVQYYYLSKKSENYKGLLKRQQRRRTRSLVRPAAATPANTEFLQNDTDKTNGFNDNHTGEAVVNELSDQNNGSKSNAPIEQVDMKKETSDLDLAENVENEAKATCCICNCNFNDTNQFRNVTRSNHQLYGIALDALRPGMKICYSCRFRHVKHPNFDEPTVGLETMENELMPGQHNNDMIAYDMTMMEVDPPVIRTDTYELRPTHMITEDTTSQPTIPITDVNHPIDTSCPPTNSSLEISNSLKQTNNIGGPSDSAVGAIKAPQQRTLVRDIIYQAIEMSFQEPQQQQKIQPPPPPPPQAQQFTQSVQLTRIPLTQSQSVRSKHQSLQHTVLAQSSIPCSTVPPLAQVSIKSPPMAHGVKDLRGAGGIDDGVLNLSVKSEKRKSPEAANLTATAPSAPVTTAPVVPVVSPVAVVTTLAAIAPIAPVANPPTPKQESNRDDSRSPSEMVIDESADAPSPESSSPKSNGQHSIDNSKHESEIEMTVNQEELATRDANKSDNSAVEKGKDSVTAAAAPATAAHLSTTAVGEVKKEMDSNGGFKSAREDRKEEDKISVPKDSSKSPSSEASRNFTTDSSKSNAVEEKETNDVGDNGAAKTENIVATAAVANQAIAMVRQKAPPPPPPTMN